MAYDLSQVRVLVVEDDQSMRTLVRDMLMAFGINHVEAVNDGSKAFEKLRHFPADIVVTDWVMETMDGLEFTQLMRNSPDSPNKFIPIIMLTSQTATKRVEMARDMGITEFLIKPVTAKGLYDRIVTVIQRPRQFVNADGYFGPDRRRTEKDFTGGDRRDDEGC